MIRITLISLFMAATSLLASTPRGEFEGTAFHSGTGKVSHDGDFIEFSLRFEAACFDERTEAWNQVVNNVSTFSQWVDFAKADALTRALRYDAEPVNIYRKDANHYDSDGCEGKYFASQVITLVLDKSDEEVALNPDVIQNFYAELQKLLWPLNQPGNEANHNRLSAIISDVEKGIYENTADALRIAGKAKAQTKATQDFLAFLGPNYQGVWHLQSVDFRERDYSGSYKVALESAIPASAPDASPLPATLKLKPLYFSVTGNFTFVYNY